MTAPREVDLMKRLNIGGVCEYGEVVEFYRPGEDRPTVKLKRSEALRFLEIARKLARRTHGETT